MYDLQILYYLVFNIEIYQNERNFYSNIYKYCYIYTKKYPKKYPYIKNAIINQLSILLQCVKKSQQKRILQLEETVSSDIEETVSSDIEETVSKTLKILINDLENLQYQELTCAICHQIITTDKIKRLKCGHIYCNSCINQWINRSHNCPTCREVIY